MAGETATAYPISFWNYVQADMQGAEAVGDWKDAGITVAMGPVFNRERDDVGRMRAILDVAQERGITVIHWDSRSLYHGMRDGEEAYKRNVAAVLEDFGDHQALFGLFLGDEPEVDGFPNACRAYRIHKEMAPHLSPLLNLLPWHEAAPQRVGYDDWAAYLDAYVEAAQPDFLCYDCYAQMDPGAEGWETYFFNLRQFQEAANRHDIPFWTTLLSAGLRRMRCPNEDDFRWQVNTAAAHGAKGLMWFFLYMREPHCNFRTPPIDEHYERTETFARLSRVNRTFLKTVAPTLRRLQLQRVRHVGQAWGGVPLFDAGGVVASLEADQPLIVSEYLDEQGRPYVSVVNNSMWECTQARLVVRGDHPKLYQVAWMGKEDETCKANGGPVRQGVDYARVTPWLAPGQMELFRVGESR